MERVLVADSSEDVRRTLCAPLEADGFAVTEACDAPGALERLRGEDHGAAFVDLHLPGGGLRLVDDVKRDPDLSRTAVILLSDDLADGQALEGIERGATDCLRKPIEPVEALVRARAALRTAALQEKLREGDERLTELAATDDLTGLLARRFLESHLRGLVAGAKRHGRELSVAMLDLDNFKEVNDTHGHAVGDFVLRTVIERMRPRIRKEDLLGRWGGDELMLLLPDIDLDGAVTAAEALREGIAATSISVDGRPTKVTLSAGVVAWRPGEDAPDLVQRADLALYDAKAAGRNRVDTGLAGRL